MSHRSPSGKRQNWPLPLRSSVCEFLQRKPEAEGSMRLAEEITILLTTIWIRGEEIRRVGTRLRGLSCSNSSSRRQGLGAFWNPIAFCRGTRNLGRRRCEVQCLYGHSDGKRKWHTRGIPWCLYVMSVCDVCMLQHSLDHEKAPYFLVDWNYFGHKLTERWIF